jgi:hypothetical protein
VFHFWDNDDTAVFSNSFVEELDHFVPTSGDCNVFVGLKILSATGAVETTLDPDTSTVLAASGTVVTFKMSADAPSEFSKIIDLGTREFTRVVR